MPNRILKDSINESRALTSCSFFSQELYKRLITYADDYGRFNADPEIVLARLYPRELAVVRLEDLMEGLIELAGVGKIAFYTAKPRHEVYGAFPNWGNHQRLRDSKAKCPDPEDTEVNDWYLRRYIPQDMKVRIIERDGFKCCSCGKQIVEGVDARRLVKMGDGLYHIDHIVPVNQGGRATMENLRLLCPKCNLSRQKHFSFEEILQFANDGGNLLDLAAESGEQQQSAATCRNSPQLAVVGESLRPESESESESNPNPNPNRNTREEADDAEAFRLQAEHNQILQAAEDAGFPRTNTVRARLIDAYAEHGKEKVLRAIEQCAMHSAASIAYLQAVLSDKPRSGQGKPAKTVIAQQYSQRDYSGQEESVDEMMERIMSINGQNAG